MKWCFRIFSAVIILLVVLTSATVNGLLPAQVGGVAMFLLMLLGPYYVLFICFDLMFSIITYAVSRRGNSQKPDDTEEN